MASSEAPAAALPPVREPLSPVDLAWLRMDHPANLMQINGVLVLEQPVSLERIRALVERRLLPIRRFHQRVVERRGKRFWEEDPGFDLAYHVQAQRLPEPAGDAELQKAIGALMSGELDHDRPLWDFRLIENYRGGSVLYCRLHHSIGDGVALMLVLLSLADLTPTGPPVARTSEEQLEEHENAFSELFRHPLKGVQSARALAEEVMPDTLRLMLHPVEGLRKVNRLAKSVGFVGALGRLVARSNDPHTALKGSLVVEKRVAWSDNLPLPEVKAVGKALGGTINDVLMTAVAGGLRRYLLRHGGTPDDLSVRAAMPVNLRPLEEMANLGNRFGLVFLALPLGIADPLERLAQLRRDSAQLRRSLEPVVIYALLKFVGMSPLLVQQAALKIFGAKATAVMTNVPGPRNPIYLGGTKVRDIFFWVPQAAKLGLGVAIFSYAGNARLGIGVDAGLIPDPDDIVRGFHEEWDELRRLAGVATS